MIGRINHAVPDCRCAAAATSQGHVADDLVGEDHGPDCSIPSTVLATDATPSLIKLFSLEDPADPRQEPAS
jgi:hypothetical protein